MYNLKFKLLYYLYVKLHVGSVRVFVLHMCVAKNVF